MIDLLHPVAAFLLALVGYSGGAVLAAEGSAARPAGWELPVAAAAALGVAIGGPGLVGGWIALPAALVLGAGVGATAGLMSGITGRPGRAGHAAEEAREDPEPESSAFRRFLLRTGEYQGRITMGFLYFGLLTPFALVSRLTDDPFRIEDHRSSYWRERADDDSPSEALRRQA